METDIWLKKKLCSTQQFLFKREKNHEIYLDKKK